MSGCSACLRLVQALVCGTDAWPLPHVTSVWRTDPWGKREGFLTGPESPSDRPEHEAEWRESMFCKLQLQPEDREIASEGAHPDTCRK